MAGLALGPVPRSVRVSLILATMKTPWHFPTKRNLWAYAGRAVMTQSSADHDFLAGRPVRRRRKPLRILRNLIPERQLRRPSWR
jgi:hypothetical protein